MELQTWQIVVLAVVQGITEFLPISSSGHLVVLAEWMSPEDATRLQVTEVNVVLHVGTLLSIVAFYWHRLWRLLGSEQRRVIGLLVWGTIPAVVFGLPVRKFASETLLENPLLAGCLLPCTGLILIWAARSPRGKQHYEHMGYGQASLIGLAQALAILPGLSRSGTTISAGLRLGLAPDSAATFSFLLAVPVIGGAGLLEVATLLGEPAARTPIASLALGMAVSFVVGLFSLWWLIRWLERGRLQWFAAWCFLLGATVIVWQIGS